MDAMNGAFKRSGGYRSPWTRRLVLLIAMVLVLVLVVYAIVSRPPADMLSDEDFTAVAVSTYSEGPVPTEALVRTGVLSESDAAEIDKIERFFGPLPVVDQPLKAPHKAVRGIYILDGQNIDQAISLAEAGHINAVVIDFKEDNGLRYPSKLPLAREIGASQNQPLQDHIGRLKEAGIYVIGRVVCFKDKPLANAHPELAIADQYGNVLGFSGEGGVAFLNPYDTRNWDYFIDVALEAIEMGADEIQFDYVRFPTGRTTSGEMPYFGDPEVIPTRSQAINRFLETARVLITEKHGVPVAADVFSIVIASRLDGDVLGQDWNTIGQTGIDSISPMVYPSHYANDASDHYTGNGQGTYLGGKLFTKPDLHPFEVTKFALLEGQVARMYGDYATVRPFLQAFTATYLPAGYYMEYDAAAIAETIAAVYAAGYDEWLLWSPQALYDEAIFTVESIQDRPDTAAEPSGS